MSGVLLWFTGGVQLHKTDVEDKGERVKSVGPAWKSKVYEVILNDPLAIYANHHLFSRV